MSKIRFQGRSTPAAPAAGKVVIFVDSSDNNLKQIDETGTVIDLTLGFDSVNEFYGINVKQSNDLQSFKGIETVTFESSSFYLTQNTPNTDEVIVNFRGTAGGGGAQGPKGDTGDTGPTGPQGPQGESGTGGFYGIVVAQTDELAVFSGISKINFEAGSFYLTQNDPNTDEVIINFRGSGGTGPQGPKGDTGDTGPAGATGSQGPAGTDGGFYEILFRESESGGYSQKDDTLTFDSQFFYLADDGSSKPLVSLHEENIDHDNLSGFVANEHLDWTADQGANDIHQNNITEASVTQHQAAIDHGSIAGLPDDDHPQYTRADGTRAFTGDQSMGGNQLTNVGEPAAGTDAARLQDIGPGFYGITITHTDNSAIFSGIEKINFEVANFYVTQNNPNTDEVIVNFRGTAGSGEQGPAGPQGPQGDTGAQGPAGADGGFYEILFKESEVGGFSQKDDTLVFDSSWFYVKNGPDQKPLVSFIPSSIVHPTPPPAGEVNTLSSLGGDESLVGTKVGDDLRIKGLTAGAGVKLTGQSNDVVIESTVEGFYGVTVSQTDELAVFRGINKINFEVGNFYLTQNDPNTDEVIVSFRGSGGQGPVGPQGPQGPTGATGADGADGADGAGFYGINVTQTNDAASFKGIQQINFNSENFYVTQNNPNTDEVAVNFRGAAGPQGPQGATGAQGDTGPQGPAGEDGGFYGIIFKESEAGGYIEQDNTLVFDSAFFYVQSDASGKPLVSFNDSALPTVVTDHGALTGLTDDDHTQYTLADGTRAFTGDQSMGSNKLTDLAAPTVSSDAARLQDVLDNQGRFYGIVVAQTDNLAVFRGLSKINFEAGNFYVTQNAPNTDEVIVNFRGSAGAGEQGPAGPQGPQGDIGPQGPAGTDGGFYGIFFEESESGGYSERDDTLVFDSSWFYVQSNASGKPLVSLNDSALPTVVTDHGALTGLTDDDHTQYTLADGTRAFTGNQSMGGNQLTNVGAPSAGTDAARLQDVLDNQGRFYGIVVSQDDGLAVFRGIEKINFEAGNFYLSQNDPNTDEVIVSFRGSGGQGPEGPQGPQGPKGDAGSPGADGTDGAGFYGIVVAQTDELAVFRGIEKVNFESDSFYVTQNSPNTDEVIVSFRGSATGPAGPQGEQGLQGDTGPQGPAGEDGGFYGILFKESEVGGFSEKDDTLVFDSSWFYVKNGPDQKPIVSFIPSSIVHPDPPPSGEVNTLSSLGGDESLVGTKVGDDLRIKGLTSGAGIKLTGQTNDVVIESTVEGFYGTTIAQTDQQAVFRNITKIDFETENFYVTQQDTDTAIVSFRGTLTQGPQGEQGPQGDTGPQGPAGQDGGFYGILFKESETGGYSQKDDTLVFDSAFFYVLDNASGKPLVSFSDSAFPTVVTDHGELSGLTDDDHTQYTLADGTRAFTGNQSMGSNRITSLAAPTDPSDAARLQDVLDNQGRFYGITTAHDDGSATFRGIRHVNFEVANFYLTQNDPNTDEVIVNFRGSGGAGPAGPTGPQGPAGADGADGADGGGGFYGVIFKESLPGTTIARDDTLVFDYNHFYVIQRTSDDKPIVSLQQDQTIATLAANSATFAGPVTVNPGQLIIGDGSNSVPAIAFASDTDTGIKLGNPDNIGFITGASTRLSITSSSVTTGSTTNIRSTSGSASIPSLGTFTDTDTGIFFPGSNEMGFSTGGAERARLTHDKFRISGGFYSVAFGEPVYELQEGTNVTITETGVGTFQIDASGAGEANDGANVGTGEGNVFRDKTTTTLNFKRLQQGANITITDNTDEIVIASTGGASSPGFYGVIFKESEAGGAVVRDDTLVFDSDHFYVSGSSDGKPLLSLQRNQTFESITAGELTVTPGKIVVDRFGAGEPSIAFSGDLDTGIASPSAGNVDIVCDGSRVVKVSPGFINLNVAQLRAQAGDTNAPGIAFAAGTSTGFSLGDGGTSIAASIGGSQRARLEHDKLTIDGGFYSSSFGEPLYDNQLPTLSKSITVESPSATEDIIMFFTSVSITVQQVRAVVRGTTPSVNVEINHNTSRSAAGNIAAVDTAITNETGGQNIPIGADPTIPADSWVWLETSAQSGTVDELGVTVEYTED